MNRKNIITKVVLALAERCATAFYYESNSPQYRTTIAESEQSIIDKGTEIGLLARQLFPNGIDVTQGGKVTGANLLNNTKKALFNKNAVLYEAAFLSKNGLYCRADILVKQGNTIRLYEVKSTTSRKEEQIFDVGVQDYIISKCGFKVEPHLIYINRDYVRDGELNLKELFKIEDVSSDVEDIHENILNSIATAKQLQTQKQLPTAIVGQKCFWPRECPFKEHCWKINVPENSVFTIGGIRKKKAEELFHSGIKLITDVKL